LYLDDLPSATKYAGRDHYDESIPLGYVPLDEEADVNESISEEGDEEFKPVHIFNHLDIVVTVHETAHSKKLGTYQDGGRSTTVNFFDHSFDVYVP